jgi:hypothetical protein
MTKEISSKDMANTSLVGSFKASLLPVLEKEKALWIQMVGLINEGELSVRGGKATIEAVNKETGALPTIAVSSVQYFQKASSVFVGVEGANQVPLKELLNTTVQGVRKLGSKRFVELVEVVTSFGKLAKVVADAPEKAKNSKPKVKGVEALIVALLEALEADEFEGVLVNIEGAEALVKQLSACVKHSKQVRSENHPALLNKAS